MWQDKDINKSAKSTLSNDGNTKQPETERQKPKQKVDVSFKSNWNLEMPLFWRKKPL